MRIPCAALAASAFAFLMPLPASAQDARTSGAGAIASMASRIPGDAGGETFQSMWDSPPDSDMEFTPFDYQVFGGWGRLGSRLAGFTGQAGGNEPELEGWNPYKNQDAYTYGAFALIHEELVFVLPGMRLEFNNIDENIVLCLDVAGPIAYAMYNKNVRIGKTTLADSTSEMCLAFHSLFAVHYYVLGEIQGPYIGPIFGFNSFYFKNQGFYAYPIAGGDLGVRLNVTGFTMCFGAMVYGMSLRRVHPDFGYEFYAGFGFLI